MRLGEQPLLAQPLERLEASPWVDAIVVAAPPEWEEPAILLAEELGAGKVSACITGGATRAESVRAAVAEVPADAAVILVHDAARPLVSGDVVARVLRPLAEDAVAVLVHDAARPLVSGDVIERVLRPLAEGWDGAVPALPLADTVKRIRGNEVVETLDRDDLRAVQTPQAFIADSLRAALGGDLAGATDCAALVEAANGRVCVVDGDPRLLKVTSAEDLELVASWL